MVQLSSRKRSVASAVILMAVSSSHAFTTPSVSHVPQHTALHMQEPSRSAVETVVKGLATAAASAVLSASLFLGGPAFAENELEAKYGGGFDASLVDKNCLVDRCSVQAKACLADDPSCRKGLTCTAKCLGDNACITGCMARYGNENLDNLLKCTIEDNECIKIAILEGGADKFGEEPRAPAPTIQHFNVRSLEGSWFKVAGYNPNYDCYACQRNTFSLPDSNKDQPNALFVSNPVAPVKKLNMDVEFSMPYLLPDGSPPPPKNVREMIEVGNNKVSGSQSIGLNDYNTHETMIFDSYADPMNNLVMQKGDKKVSYSRTAHSEGEMFGLKFWENWYILGENAPGEPEFKFIYYNGKTRQNTYEGAFVYSRSRELPKESMERVYNIAKEAGMNPDQFCRIRNGCFTEVKVPDSGLGAPSNPLRGFLASTKVSQLLGVEPVAAQDTIVRRTPTASVLQPSLPEPRPWWQEVGDYLENPHRHFQTMDNLRQGIEWPDDVKATQK